MKLLFFLILLLTHFGMGHSVETGATVSIEVPSPRGACLRQTVSNRGNRVCGVLNLEGAPPRQSWRRSYPLGKQIGKGHCPFFNTFTIRRSISVSLGLLRPLKAFNCYGFGHCEQDPERPLALAGLFSVQVNVGTPPELNGGAHTMTEPDVASVRFGRVFYLRGQRNSGRLV